MTPPILGDLELQLQPPAYTGLPARAIPASGGDLRALRGTEVVIHARSLVGPVRKAELEVKAEGGAAHSFAAVVTRKEGEAAPILVARFRVDEPGSYAFVLWRWTGRQAEPAPHRIELEADLAPRLELRVPADPLELAVPRPVELAYEVEDDFGIGDVALVYQTGEQAPVRKPLSPERPTPRRARGRFLWELGELERTAPLPPGAHISYWIEAHDNDGVAGPKLARSPTRVIVLGVKTDPARIDRANLEALLEATLATLEGRLTPGKSTEGQHAALAALGSKFADVARLERDDKKPGGATLALRKLATQAAARLQRLVTEEASTLGPRAMHDKVVTELEADGLQLDDLRGRRRLEEMARLGDEMRRARDDLKRLFQELKTASSDAQKAELRREIERKLTEIEAKMAELRRVAAQAEGEVPDEFLNREAIGKQDLSRGVDDIRKMLERGDMDKAMAELERMSRSLDKLAGALDKDLNSFRGERNPEEEKAMAALENDLADLAKEEREVESESRAIRDRAGDAAEQRGGDLKALHEKLRPKLAELDRKASDQVKDEHLVDREHIERLRARAQAVGRALDANDLDEAQAMALDARRLAQSASSSLRSYEEQAEAEAQARVGDGPTPSLKRSSKRMGEAEGLARQIEAELQKAEASRKPGVSEGDRRRLEELQQRQQAAQQRGEELGRRLSQPGAPGLGSLPQNVRGDVDGARQSMGESGRQLSRPAPGRAAQSAGQAAEKLESARKRVSDARRGGEGGGSSGGHDGEGNENRDQEVRIPGADDSAAPRAFREELLDAMKRGAPRKFEDQVRQYYEELVR